MKKLFIACVSILIGSNLNAQSNTLPPSGNVGIGTTNPETRLDVKGRVNIDSTLLVRDSVTIKRNLRVEENVTFLGNTKMKNVRVRHKFRADSTAKFNGKVRMVNLETPASLNNKNVIISNANGTLKKVKIDSFTNYLKAEIYQPVPEFEEIGCLVDNNGNMIYATPFWQASQQKMFLLNNQCMPNNMLGIGAIPEAKVHIRTSPGFLTHPLLIEKPTGFNQYKKLLQLDNNGLLYAREVKVNLAIWPDYVFKKEYSLMPLQQVENYIKENGHLPNIPSSETVKEEGVHLGEMNKLLLEKIEELTLHLIEQQKRIEALENQK